MLGADVPITDLCEACGECPLAFRVKSRGTARHWRCLGCLRRMTGPVVVTGSRVSGGTKHIADVNLVAELVALDIMRRVEDGTRLAQLITEYGRAKVRGAAKKKEAFSAGSDDESEDATLAYYAETSNRRRTAVDLVELLLGDNWPYTEEDDE